MLEKNVDVMFENSERSRDEVENWVVVVMVEVELLLLCEFVVVGSDEEELVSERR